MQYLMERYRFQFMAAMFVLEGVVMAQFALKVGRLNTQALFLADIVQRNVDLLEEFDIIALKELGLLSEVKKS